MTRTPLSQRIIDRANADGLPDDHALRKAADKLDEIMTGYYADPQTVTMKQYVGTWAATRLAWCAYSGEQLL